MDELGIIYQYSGSEERVADASPAVLIAHIKVFQHDSLAFPCRVCRKIQGIAYNLRRSL